MLELNDDELLWWNDVEKATPGCDDAEAEDINDICHAEDMHDNGNAKYMDDIIKDHVDFGKTSSNRTQKKEK